MHRLALRLIEEGPYADPEELGQRLQEQLGDGVRKTPAKYLDEFNWYVMVGATRRSLHMTSQRVRAQPVTGFGSCATEGP